jgi:hypothetical protein
MAAQDAEVTVHGGALLKRVSELANDAKRIQRQAERAGDLRTALMAIRELSRIVQLLTDMRPASAEQPIILHFDRDCELL